MGDHRTLPKFERFALALRGPTLVTDGQCNLCSGAGSFIQARLDSKSRIFYIWAQHPETIELLEPLGLTESDLMKSWALLRDNEIFRGTDAWIEVGKCLTQPWRFIFAVIAIVPRFIREAVYHLIAKHRYQIFGGTDDCQRPEKERIFSFLHSV